MVNPVTAPLEPAQQPSKRHKPAPSLISNAVKFLGGALLAVLLVWSLLSFSGPSSPDDILSTSNSRARARPDPKTFYDDPGMSYWLDRPVGNWDEKRRQWLDLNPKFGGNGDRVVMVTGSQPAPCKSRTGDHLLLRLFKNKVDYCRIHGCDVFYNNVLLNPKMFGYWAKYAVIRAAMVAHPEAEWFWWVDSDALFTDMDFALPLDRYRDHNLVVHGWSKEVFDKRSWTGLNAGVFLIRNCQWSMDFLTRWVEFGPQSPDYEKWGRIEKSVFTDKLYPDSDDQTGLAYLLVMEGEKWGDKVYLEGEYYFEGYWMEIVGKLDDVTRQYKKVERREGELRRRHAEKSRTRWEEYLSGSDTGGYAKRSWRRPFITHFTGCEPCSGEHNEMYSWEECWDGMIKALNFADNQVLRNFGYFRPDLSNSSRVEPLSFD